LRLLPDGFDTVEELYTLDHLGQLVVAVEATPARLGRLSELEDLASAVLLERQPFARTVRWRTVAKLPSSTNALNLPSSSATEARSIASTGMGSGAKGPDASLPASWYMMLA
jgi:hypothetical protein